jgi:hypothetical protein
METTLTKFQREFKKARQAADAGVSVFIDGGAVRYVFMKEIPDTNPFAGLEHIFGKPKKLKPHASGAKKRRH